MRFLSGFCFWLFRSLSVLCEAVVISQGSALFSGPLSPSRPDPCLFFNCLSSSFLSMSGAFVDAVSLSLSLFLSFSGAGETQTPCGVWVSPCVLCIPAANFVFDPYSVVLNFPKVSPRTCFFFFSSLDRRLGVFLVSCLVGVGGHGGCLLWSVMVRCLRFLSRPSGVFFFLLGWWGSPCCVSPVVSPWFLGGRGCVFPCRFLHLASPLASRSTWSTDPQPPRPLQLLAFVRPASPVSCWESSVGRAEAKSYRVTGGFVTLHTV